MTLLLLTGLCHTVSDQVHQFIGCTADHPAYVLVLLACFCYVIKVVLFGWFGGVCSLQQVPPCHGARCSFMHM